MFAALSENTKFFKDRMNLFVAIAPGVFMKNMLSETIKLMNK